ncbi:hypothetical protein GUJ93_ZPchr0003g18496 [Zizania palustris]|uniref:Guanine nucleotide exchange factor SPIKE 1 n=1 Tax=Zizania palustris TaxID=103762 RepID=A0A8J5RZ93_ZIZPA|nr:hypothetical protein GUJ93_ZPchr0003g18496 [Zizania palustris]
MQSQVKAIQDSKVQTMTCPIRYSSLPLSLSLFTARRSSMCAGARTVRISKAGGWRTSARLRFSGKRRSPGSGPRRRDPELRFVSSLAKVAAMDSAAATGEGQRFKRIPRQSLGGNLELDPLLNENLDQWPHLNELVQCYKADFVKDDCKYGRYENVAPPSFQNQIFEGPDTDIETELQLCNVRQSKPDETTEDDTPSTSGRQIYETEMPASSSKKHCSLSPLPAYEPAFDWENERSLIFGQRVPESIPAINNSGLKITVKVLSLSFQAGLVEPFSGTICLYNRDRREKLSEDFYFHILPTEMQDAQASIDRRGVFSLDAPSPSVCLLIQLEKAATEEGGVTPSVYSRKEPVHLTEKEKQKLQVWSRIMPYRESFAWAMIPLFENHTGGAASPSSPLAPSMSGSSSQDSIVEPISKLTVDGKLNHYSNGSSVIVEISSLNKVKESYIEDSLQDPKRKVHKPVKGVLRLEVEKLHNGHYDMDNNSEGGSMANDLNDAGELNNGRYNRSSFDGIHGSLNSSTIIQKDAHQNGQASNTESGENFQAFDFRMMTRSEPFSQLFHCLYVYPLTISLSRKRNLFVRVELRKDDSDIRKPPSEAVHPRDRSTTLEKWVHTQVAVGTRMACYHDEIKISLPALLTPQHHLLFTFFHVDLQMKLEAPKPVVMGYAVLPLSTHIQLLSDVSLPILRELAPHYLQESGKERMDYLEDGKTVFRLRLRLCSSLFPVNERIRDFFVEYDRHTLHTSPPWGSELLEVSFSFLHDCEDVPPLQLKEGVFRCIMQLFDCLLTEVHERCKKGLSLAKRLNSTLAFFCNDLLSVIEPRQVFELVSLYMDKFAGVCQSILHDCKLTFLQIICDHDLFVEMPGRDPSDRNYLSSVLIQEIFLTLDHDDLPQRAKAARILVVLICKHEFDARYQKSEDKLYIAQLYFPLIGQILDEMPVFYNLNAVEKREVLVVILQIIRNLDDMTLIKAWQQSIARTRLFFKLLEECIAHFEHNKMGDSLLLGSSSRSPDSERPASPKYSDRLSPSVNAYLSEASRHEIRPQGTPENGYMWNRASPQLSSPNQPYSLREALAQAQSSRIGSTARALRESLHPVLRQKLELWEENLSTTPLAFWKAFLPVVYNILNLHGATLMARENDRFLKQIAFHLLRLAVFRNDSIRKRAVVGLQILVRNSFNYFKNTTRLRVMLTITLSELMSDVQVTQMKSDGSLEESGEIRRLRKSLEEMADVRSKDLLKDCGLPITALEVAPEGPTDNRWSWVEVKHLSKCLVQALDAGLDHALLGSAMTLDRYAAAEGFYKLAMAYAPVPDLHIMWLLHLCDAHQEMQSWAEAAQCAVAVAGVIMQALVGRNDTVWSKEHVASLCKICPIVNTDVSSEASAAEVEGYGASKLTVDSAVKYLQLANKLFAQAELYHFCASIQELIIPVYKSRRSYGQLAKCHTSLKDIYESILEQEASPIPFIDATYYRVGFYGERFGKLNKKEYVFREPRDVRLGDIMEKLSHIYETKMDGSHTLHIIPDSRQVNADELQPGVYYLQITAVDPVMEDEDLGSRRERIFSLSTESLEFSPVENAIGMIETRTAALRNELEEPRSSEGDQLPRLQSLQRILQGSVAVQVNSGVLSVCTAFLSGEPATRLRSQELQQLIAALLEFMAVCKRAIRVHFRLIGEEDQEFHTQLVNGFQSLTAELSHYIPAILSEL